MKKKLISIFQLAVGIGLLVYLFHGMKDKSDLLAAVKSGLHHWPLLMAAFLWFGVCLLLCAVRWKLLLDARGLVMPFRRVVTLLFVGHFFNSFLFGSTGGDLVKAWYVAREMPSKRAEAVATVFVDRLVGLLALVILTVVIMVLRLDFFLSTRETRLALAFILFMLVGSVTGMLLIFRRNLLERWAFFRRLEARTALGKILGRAYATFHLCLNERGLVVKTTVISILNHLWGLVLCFYLGMAMEIPLGFLSYFTVFPVINAIGALPLTPGGLGTRDGAAKLLLGVLGVPATRAVPLTLLAYGTMLCWSLVGGIIYLGFSLRQGTPAAADGATVEDRNG